MKQIYIEPKTVGEMIVDGDLNERNVLKQLSEEDIQELLSKMPVNKDVATPAEADGIALDPSGRVAIPFDVLI